MLVEWYDFSSIQWVVENHILICCISIIDVHYAEISAKQTSWVKTDFIETIAGRNLDSVSQLVGVLITDEFCRNCCWCDIAFNLFAILVNSHIHQLEHVGTKSAALGCHNEACLDGRWTVRDESFFLLDAADVWITDGYTAEIWGIAVRVGWYDICRVLYYRQNVYAGIVAIAKLIYRILRVRIIQYGFLLWFRTIFCRVVIVYGDCLIATILVCQLHHYSNFIVSIFLVTVGLAEVDGVVWIVEFHIRVSRPFDAPFCIRIVCLVPIELIVRVAVA